MKYFNLLLAIALAPLAACSSHRQTMVDESTADSLAASRRVERFEASARWLERAAALDADSIVIRPDGSAVIHGASLIASETAAERAEATEVTNDSVTARREAERHENEAVEETAVYQPPDLRWVWGLAAVMVAMVCAIKFLKK